MPGKVVGPAFGALEVPGVIEAVLDTYRLYRQNGDSFINTLKRVGFDVFKNAANAARLLEKHEEMNVLPKAPNFARDAQEA